MLGTLFGYSSARGKRAPGPLPCNIGRHYLLGGRGSRRNCFGSYHIELMFGLGGKGLCGKGLGADNASQIDPAIAPTK